MLLWYGMLLWEEEEAANEYEAEAIEYSTDNIRYHHHVTSSYIWKRTRLQILKTSSYVEHKKYNPKSLSADDRISPETQMVYKLTLRHLPSFYSACLTVTAVQPH